MSFKKIERILCILREVLEININSELGTLEWDTFNPDCLIRISNVDTFSFLIHSFFGYNREKSKTVFF